MAARISERRKKKIIADYIQTENYSATARLNGCAANTVKVIVSQNAEIARLCEEKKEESAQDVLDYMAKATETVCEIIANGLEELRKPEKMEAATPSQITTMIGTLIDKWAMINGGASDGDKVRVIIDV